MLAKNSTHISNRCRTKQLDHQYHTISAQKCRQGYSVGRSTTANKVDEQLRHNVFAKHHWRDIAVNPHLTDEMVFEHFDKVIRYTAGECVYQ